MAMSNLARKRMEINLAIGKTKIRGCPKKSEVAVSPPEMEAFRRLPRPKPGEISPDWVIERLIDNLERAMTPLPILYADGTQTGEYRYNGAVANRALELIGKHLGMFVDKIASTDLTGLTIEEQRAALRRLRDEQNQDVADN